MRLRAPITHWLFDGVVVTYLNSPLPVAAIDSELKSVRRISGVLSSWRHIIVLNRAAVSRVSHADSLILQQSLRDAFGGFSSSRVALVSASEHIVADLHRVASTMRTDRLHVQVFANLPSAFGWIRSAKTLSQNVAPADLAAHPRATLGWDRTHIDRFGEN